VCATGAHWQGRVTEDDTTVMILCSMVTLMVSLSRRRPRGGTHWHRGWQTGPLRHRDPLRLRQDATDTATWNRGGTGTLRGSPAARAAAWPRRCHWQCRRGGPGVHTRGRVTQVRSGSQPNLKSVMPDFSPLPPSLSPDHGHGSARAVPTGIELDSESLRLKTPRDNCPRRAWLLPGPWQIAEH
jgi:hypothetical protein